MEFKLSKAKMADYLFNKKQVNNWFWDKMYYQILQWDLKVEEASFIGNKPTTLYLSHKAGEKQLRVSTHRKKDYNREESGIVITMREVKKNDPDAVLNKIKTALNKIK